MDVIGQKYWINRNKELSMKVNAIKCKNCNTIIYSRATHDFHWCPCGKCAIDGGFEYIKITGDRKDWELAEYEVLDNLSDGDAKNVLYNDWNLKDNKYGIAALDNGGSDYPSGDEIA
jgi:hypothetical protein